MKKMKIFHAGRGRTRLRLELRRAGGDWVALLTGGAAHAGAAALAWPGRAGRTAARRLCAPGHREGGLALGLARAVSKSGGARCAAVAGIHLDAITRAEIRAVLQNAAALTKRAQAHVREPRPR